MIYRVLRIACLAIVNFEEYLLTKLYPGEDVSTVACIVVAVGL
jgi:hypothetical protein